ncbi:hypothetical protein QTP88_002317 [Uroleucon formosanum]
MEVSRLNAELSLEAFGGNGPRNYSYDAYRDRLIVGLADEACQRKFLGESSLTFHYKNKPQSNTDQFKKNTSVVSSRSKQGSQSYSQSQQGSSKDTSQCYRCERTHDARNCTAKQWECFNCKLKGHVSVMCRNKKKILNYIENLKVNEPLIIDLFINDITVISKVIFDRYFRKTELKKEKCNLSLVNRESITVVSQLIVNVSSSKKKIIKLPLIATKNYHEVNLEIRENSVPKFQRAYKVPYALKPAVEEELVRLEKEGVKSHMITSSIIIIEQLPLTFHEIAKETSENDVIKIVCEQVKSSWVDYTNIKNESEPYYRRRSELSIKKECLILGNRVVVPNILRQQVLNILYKNHPSIVRSKLLARSYVW